MKKMLFGVAALAVVFTATGCGGKKLTCTQKEDSMEAKYTLSFKNNKISTINMKMTMSGVADQATDDMVKAMCDSFKEEEEFKGAVTKCETKKSGKDIIVNANIDASKVKESTFSASKSYDDVKKELTDKGYSCK